MHINVEELDQSVKQALQWIADVDERMGTRNRRLAMTSLQCTLQAVRRQLDPDQVARLAKCLPIPLKGAMFENWRPAAPSPATSRSEFLGHIKETVFRNLDISVERGVKASLEVMCKRIPAEVVAEFAGRLPFDLRSLWSNEPLPYPGHGAV
ncbi:DUF2267 domain-containing protein [Pseudomonas luteola]|uniref:DUF2267 domain-containing protein n=1 Tax=Pseudomonas luteola TaxID=47886 RepID=UPI00123BFE8E|nr:MULTISPECIES: DUF2267 domain-containing protein [Pseudomonas]MBA1248657.1 DUF2267 domain-containing protein [Pseudomonas zeshuii]QEU27800.1 DUF2267 domain-containing protein [Pseudomonas luteola]